MTRFPPFASARSNSTFRRPAALSGYSDWPWRVIARRLGASYTLVRVLAGRNSWCKSVGGKRANRYLRVTTKNIPWPPN